MGKAAVESVQANGAADNADNLTAAQRKKLKQKQRKQAKRIEREELDKKQQEFENTKKAVKKQDKTSEDAVEIEYVSAPLEVLLASTAEPSAEADRDGNGASAMDTDEGPAAGISEFAKIFERFGSVEQLMGKDTDDDGNLDADGNKNKKHSDDDEDDEDDDAQQGRRDKDDDDSDDDDDDEEKLSKRKRKLANQMKIAELKQSCAHPEVVEVWDVTAADPKLLVYLKGYRNTVPVPRHWSQKRKYLQGKRGLEKPAFKLPAFIEATGIGEIRQTYLEKQETQKLKQKARERMTPKMGKLDIDYQILHDAFFKHQTKPVLSRHGEIYYEGKEFEATTKHAKPGYLSPQLQEALGITPNVPPPWLVAMQRYGPPPSYRSLRIPGLNAPIPSGAQFGYHTGGWGKPPVDEYGNPIYGDVFGQGLDQDAEEERMFEHEGHWGDVEEDEEESEEESEEEEEEDEEGGEGEGDLDSALADGYTSVQSGFASSLPSGIETPAEVMLRKQTEVEPEEDTGPKQLYSVLEEKAASIGGALMGSEHTYVIPGQTKEKKMSIAAQKRLEALRREMPSDLDVAIDPSDLEGLDDNALRELYEGRLKEQRTAAGREDFSDLVAAKAMSQKRKAPESGKAGKDKKFKF